MALMEDQAFSRTFRRRQPAFNGLIWAYHWLQVGLYEPLVLARTPAEAKGRCRGGGGALLAHGERPSSIPASCR